MKTKKPFYKKPWLWIVIGVFLFVCLIGSCSEETPPETDTSSPQISQEEQLSKWGKKLKSLGINPSNEEILLSVLPDITLLDKTTATHNFLATANGKTYYVTTNTNNDICQISTTEYLYEFRTILYPEFKEPNLFTYSFSDITEDWFFDMKETSSKYQGQCGYITIDYGQWYHFPSLEDSVYLAYLLEYDYTKFIKVIFKTQDGLEASKNYQWGWDDITISGKIVEYNNDGIVIYAYDVIAP